MTTTSNTTTDNPAAPELEPRPFSSSAWLSPADARKWCDALASGYVSGKDVPAHRCPYARLLDRYLVSNCSPILPGPVHVVEKESQPLDASHWAKPNEKPPVVPPPDSGQVSTAVLAEGYLAFSTVYDENNYAFIHQPGTNAWTTVIVMNGKYKTVPSMVASVYGGTSDTGFITSLDLEPGTVWLRRSFGTAQDDVTRLEKYVDDGATALRLVKAVDCPANESRSFTFQVLGPHLYVDGGKLVYDRELNLLVENSTQQPSYTFVSYDATTGNAVRPDSVWVGPREQGSAWYSQITTVRDVVGGKLPVGRTLDMMIPYSYSNDVGYWQPIAYQGHYLAHFVTFDRGGNSGTDTVLNLGVSLENQKFLSRGPAGTTSNQGNSTWDAGEFIFNFYGVNQIKLIPKSSILAGKAEFRIVSPQGTPLWFTHSNSTTFQNSYNNARQSKASAIIMQVSTSATPTSASMRVALLRFA